MTFPTRCFIWVVIAGIAQGFISPSSFRIVGTAPSAAAAVAAPCQRLRSTPPGADIEQPAAEEELPLATAINTEASDAASPLAPTARGKVNEIDFCIAPADVSLSRSYAAAVAVQPTDPASPRLLSLTRALNNASNRAVRRILLARSWPSAEALNLSLRQVLAADKLRKEAKTTMEGDVEMSTAKCPVPRPILNVLVGKKRGSSTQPVPRGRTDEEYVADQVMSFREKYGAVPGFPLAEAYLECILSLATSGVESPRVSEVMESGVYDESYRRMIAVLRSVGTVFEPVPNTDRTRIASKLVDQDICLSMLDKLAIKQEKLKKPAEEVEHKNEPTTEPKVNAASADVQTETNEAAEPAEKKDSKSRRKLKFWKKDGDTLKDNGEQAKNVTTMEESETESDKEEEAELTQDDLGGVLLSAEEPTMTRQLNVLSNIVQRALLFGGDQELLVLYETLNADTPAFIHRWYPGTEIIGVDDSRLKDETRPGVQYLNCLVQLLRDCYNNGVVTTSDPPLPLIPSYYNAYERLIASLVELGSGYIRLVSSSPKMPVPRTAQEELGRFAVWESSFRKSIPDVSSYPEDLEGSWEVKDEIGGEEIGISTVVFKPQGQVEVAPPMQGLRWRLDPGPTHLDTCTFQVLGDDGTILQYRGFIDRGARLEARFSKRALRIRGSVMFQMRDGESVIMGEGYRKDILPINYRTGTTKFVMTRAIQEQSKK